MTRIAAYAIMRNEEANVMGWLQSASEADAAYVLDTGSTDDTVAMLRGGGVMVQEEERKATFDFAAARNTSLAMVPDDVTLAVWLDADERLTPGWRAEIDEDPYHDAMGMLLDSQGGQAWRTHPRVQVHNPHTHRWFYPVHEELEGPKPTRRLNARVLPDNRARGHHSWLAPLHEAVEKYPRSARMHFYLGRDLLLAGKTDEAERELRRCLDIPTGDRTHHAEAMRLMFDITGSVGWLFRSLATVPYRREVWVDMCVRQRKHGHTEDARRAWKAAATCTDEWLWTTFHYAWDAAFDQLGRDLGMGL